MKLVNIVLISVKKSTPGENNEPSQTRESCDTIVKLVRDYSQLSSKKSDSLILVRIVVVTAGILHQLSEEAKNYLLTPPVSAT